jgi:hypothetical protein
VLLVVLALAGVRAPAPARKVATVFVVDLSVSVPPAAREDALRWVEEALARGGPDDVGGVVTFGAAPRVEVPVGPVARVNAIYLASTMAS